VCWSKGAPVSLSGSYLSALLPSVEAPYPGTLRVTRTLYPDDGETTDFAIESTTQPTDTTPLAWQWSSRFGSTNPIRMAAVNVSGTQHDTYRGFLAGIVFGIAGGALITLISELVAPFSRRRDQASSA
jgi:hypothetical protein